MNRSTSISSRTSSSYVGDWIEPLARVGFATKGVVYTIIGVLAVQAAFTTGGSTEGTRGAILSIADEQFGQILIGVVAIGLFGYALWRFVEALLDPSHEGTDAKGIAKRAAYGVSGLIYLGLAVWSAWMVLGSGSGGSGGGSKTQWTATLMAQPFGQWLVGLAGAAVIIVGLYHFKKAYTASFLRKYTSGEMHSRVRRWAKPIGQWGLAARGVAFCIIGGFLVQAALQSDPSETRGLSGALQTLAEQPYGPWLLGAVALGFVAYGVHCFALARYASFDV